MIVTFLVCWQSCTFTKTEENWKDVVIHNDDVDGRGTNNLIINVNV